MQVNVLRPKGTISRFGVPSWYINEMIIMTADNQDFLKSVFDLSEEEMNRRMKQRLDELKNEIFEKGLPLTYQDDRCPTPCHYIREYKDGRIHLAEFDPDKMEFKFVRDITHG